MSITYSCNNGERVQESPSESPLSSLLELLAVISFTNRVHANLLELFHLKLQFSGRNQQNESKNTQPPCRQRSSTGPDQVDSLGTWHSTLRQLLVHELQSQTIVSGTHAWHMMSRSKIKILGWFICSEKFCFKIKQPCCKTVLISDILSLLSTALPNPKSRSKTPQLCVKVSLGWKSSDADIPQW